MHRLIPLLFIPMIGCGILFQETSCDLREDSVNGPEPRCQERSGTQGNAIFAGFCDALGGEGVDGLCPDRDDIVFGCEVGSPDVVDWYYPPMTADDAELECGSDAILAAP